jgi:beta-N-acetylhexosaminidase
LSRTSAKAGTGKRENTKVPLPVIFGCAGLTLGEEEARFFEEADPLGFILFARNVADPDQIRSLITDLRAAVGRKYAPVFIDQEGGRVARLKPPHWRAAAPAARFGELAKRDLGLGIEACRLNGRLLAADLRPLGITVDCVPCLDIPVSGAHDIIGDRAFGTDPGLVAALGRAQIDGVTAGGVLPVIKHIPGHGRARVDSHLSLPVVEADLATLDSTDFAPFRALRDAPLAMTAHIVYTAVDDRAAITVSAKGIAEIIRRRIGFGGILISDDLCMEALGGSPADRAEAAMKAGCDLVLHCNGKIEDMIAVAHALEPMTAEAWRRVKPVFARALTPEPIDAAAVSARLDELLAMSAGSVA